MQTIKTGVVVALLLAVCYGAFVALNAPEPDIPDELLSEFDWATDESGMDDLMAIEMPATEGIAASNTSSSAVSRTNPSNDLDASLPKLDTPELSLPSLPSFNSDASLPNSTPGVGSSTSGSQAQPAFPQISGLPAINTQPPTADAFQASDGPAVALPPPTAKNNTSTASGQLVSQTRTPANEPDPSQLAGLSPAAPYSSAAGIGNQPEQPSLPFSTAREQALQLAAKGQLRDALQQLSAYYNSPELTHADHADLVDILDALSREVIYSRRHLAQPPYVATVSDSVASIAEKHQITPELFASINGLGDSKAIVPGTEVKVLQGPFRAHVSLNRGEMTLFMGDMYAGRFPISLGKDPVPTEGNYEIVDRRRDRTYYATGGRVIPANDPRNPYGGYWLNLGQDLCIHGTPEMSSSDLADAGCISLAPLDAGDVYKILAQGCQVVITR